MRSPIAHMGWTGRVLGAVLLLGMMAAPLRADAPRPITFARAGRQVVAQVMDTKEAVPTVVLRAFGRVWTEPVEVGDKGTLFQVPSVRVPTVFAITSPDPDVEFLGEIVAYPDRDIEWDKKVRLIALGAPKWFVEWSFAVGLPVQWIVNPGKLPVEIPRLAEGECALLTLGRDMAGKGIADPLKLSMDKNVNILVLDAKWFGEDAGPASVAAASVSTAPFRIWELAEFVEKWPKRLEFASHRRPAQEIANRWAWLVDKDGLPLVEAVTQPVPPLASLRPVMLSYLPWEEQLGRSESADAALLALLQEAAKASLAQVEWRRPEFVFPEREKLKAEERPVLCAAANTPIPWKDLPAAVQILDARGKEGAPPELLHKLRPVGQTNYLLILGDDAAFEGWLWLRDAKKRGMPEPWLTWIKDDALPPSKDAQIKLMMKLTELGVPLGPIEQEAKP